ncbi:MAG: hypothetical protein JST43_05935 [Bacteroidetes bacterium]|nr:hypothetical protein [Bacteroidota bacterium]MBS1539333.1 hypothetical protein [Bacteroidota bacterium]
MKKSLLTIVWLKYGAIMLFMLAKKISHFGIDVFHLIKTDSGWKIFNLAYDVHKTGCQIPPEILNQLK